MKNMIISYEKDLYGHKGDYVEIKKKNHQHDIMNLLGSKTIAYNPEIAKHFGSDIVTAIFLNQLLYWMGKGSSKTETYKTYVEFFEETALTKCMCQRAHRKLQGIRWLIVERKGLPPKNFYRLCKEQILKDLKEWSINGWRKSDNSEESCLSLGREPTDSTREILPTNTESTQRIPKNTKSQKKEKEKPKVETVIDAPVSPKNPKLKMVDPRIASAVWTSDAPPKNPCENQPDPCYSIPADFDIDKFEKEIVFLGRDPDQYESMGTKPFVRELMAYVRTHHCLMPADYSFGSMWKDRRALGIAKTLGKWITPYAFPTIMAFVNQHSGFKDMSFPTIMYFVKLYFEANKEPSF